MMKFSVIVLLYNSQLEKIYLTINSIVKQTLKDIEIVIADDGSSTNYYKLIEDYFIKENFLNYHFTPVKQNVGTVCNILDGLKLCSGKYVRLIGAGDLLFNEFTLELVYNYMEETCAKFCFGRMRQYSMDKEKVILKGPFRAPKDIVSYKKNKYNEKQKKIKKNILIYGDWISGASIFYERRLLFSYLDEMKKTVKYCEDLITAKLVLDNERIYFIDHIVTWYEVGVGISTSTNNKALNRILLDQNNFYNYLIDHYEEKMLLKGKKLLQYNNKNFLLRNRVKRLIIAPGRIKFALTIMLQKYLNLHDKTEKGFLDF